MFDYEQQIFNAIDEHRYLWIKKATGLGITELILRLMAWLCLKDDQFKGTQMCIVTGPRIELAVGLIDRIKQFFSEADVSFDTAQDVVRLNGCEIRAYPSHHLDTMRGLPAPSFIFLDEGAFFPPGQQKDARDVSERYIAKSNPFIVMVSTPNAPEGLFETIEKEPDDICLYHRIQLPYTVGKGKIYTVEEIQAARESPSFEREYNLKYIGQIGNVFSPSSIEKAIANGQVLEDLRKGSIPPYTDKSMGIDAAFGSSKFGIVVTHLKKPEGIAEVLYSEEFDKPDFNYMLEVIKKIRATFGVKMLFCDDANPEVIRSLKAIYNEPIDYRKDLERIRSKNLELYKWMQIIPVSFRSEHKEMLSHVKMMLDSQTLAVSPSHSKLLVALRTAWAQDGDLKKDVTSHDDLLDALQLSCKLWVISR